MASPSSMRLGILALSCQYALNNAPSVASSRAPGSPACRCYREGNVGRRGSFAGSLMCSTVERVLCEAYPKESRRQEVRRTLVISCSLVFLVVALRLFTRMKYAGGLWGDDYMTIFAATLYVGNLVYTVLQAAVKLSIILFLRRIFPSQTFRRIAQAIEIILLLHGTLFTIPFAVQCIPVRSIWDRTITDRQCLNLQAVGYSSGGLAMAEDIAILLLPIPHVWQLKISLPRRLAVIALFSVGSLACVTSAIRIKYLVEYSTTFDETWDHVDIVVWSFIEQSVAMLCASLPTLRLLLVSIASRRRPASSGSFFHKESPKQIWSWSLDRMRRCRVQIQKDGDPAPQQTGEGVLVTTTVEVDRHSYMAMDLPPFPPPAYSGPRNNA
ncbi:integral membrane protein [Colletotrichum incanum]|uniref:Integral membrane protein n=1 Tax=Colletotrichum incanum TaxID=1573173 RepID=A0A167DIB2_COLIC|nr:integral membrane protein [Colletotrichum incanum]